MLMTSNHYHPRGPKASAASAIMPKSQRPASGKVPTYANEDAAEAIEARAATADLVAERDKASILSNKGGLPKVGGIFFKQECAKAGA